MAQAKEKFEQERDKILKELPDNVKAMFGTMGFCKAEHDEEEEENYPEEDWIPVLVVSPYEVPPRPVRDVYWFDLFSKMKRTKKLAELEYLVYHYGSDDPLDCYSFIPQNEFKSYEDGIAEGYDNLPSFIQTKVDSGEELTEEEQMRVRGLQEMKEDALKPAAERKRGNWQFKERHEEKSEAPVKKPPAKRQKKS
jgi:hypothetical protein